MVASSLSDSFERVPESPGIVLLSFSFSEALLQRCWNCVMAIVPAKPAAPPATKPFQSCFLAIPRLLVEDLEMQGKATAQPRTSVIRAKARGYCNFRVCLPLCSDARWPLGRHSEFEVLTPIDKRPPRK